MGMHIHHWKNNENKVSTRYFNCQFFGKASAQDIFNCFIICMSPLETNLVFLRLLDEKGNNHEVDPLRDICSCGLHVVHQSFITEKVYLVGMLKRSFLPIIEYFKNLCTAEPVMRV